DEVRQQRIGGGIVRFGVVAVAAEGMTHAARRFPLLLLNGGEAGVLRRSEIAVRNGLRDDALHRLRMLPDIALRGTVEEAAHRLVSHQLRKEALMYPAIVYHTFGNGVVVVREKLQQVVEPCRP